MPRANSVLIISFSGLLLSNFGWPTFHAIKLLMPASVIIILSMLTSGYGKCLKNLSRFQFIYRWLYQKDYFPRDRLHFCLRWCNCQPFCVQRTRSNSRLSHWDEHCFRPYCCRRDLSPTSMVNLASFISPFSYLPFQSRHSLISIYSHP